LPVPASPLIAQDPHKSHPLNIDVYKSPVGACHSVGRVKKRCVAAFGVARRLQ
jgi:hypothetical protein